MRLRVSLGTFLGVFLTVAIARLAQAQSLSLFPSGDHIVYVPSSSALSQQVGYLRGATGALTPIPGSTNSCNRATSAVVDSGMKYFFVTDSGRGKVCSHRINPSTYALLPVVGSPFGSGSTPSGIALDPSGRFLFTSNASSNDVSAYAVNVATGTLTAAPGSPFPAGGTPSAVATDASGRYVYVANNTSNDVSGYMLNQITGVLAPMPGSPFKTLGHGPSAIAADPLGRFLYVTDETSNDLTVFSLSSNGLPRLALGSPYALASSPVGVAADPSGRFLYVLGADVSAFRVNADGSLSSLGGPVSAGASPVAVAVDLSGRFVYVANAAPNSVFGYTLEPAGTLTPIPGFPFPVGSPPAGLAMSGSMPSNDSARVGDWYSNNLSAGGGRPPYDFSIDSGVLPPGLSIGRKTGLISGTPTAAGSYTFTVRVFDANVATASRSLTLVIVEPTAASIDAFLPSSARTPGSNGAYYTTDLTVANTSTSAATVTLQFLGHDQDGTGGSQKNSTLDAGKSATYVDVLSSLFGRLNDFGAIRISSASANLVTLGQTSTSGFGGTFGQSVPAARPSDLVTAASPRSIVGVREDVAFRSNLVLNNTTASSLDIDVVLVAADGTTLGSKRYTLPPLGMKQVSGVVRDLGVSGDVVGARLVLSTPTPGGAFATYASAIDNATNDPRTLLPRGPLASPAGVNIWLLPSSARAPGTNGAFYTTELTVANAGGVDATFTLKFLGHDQDGTSGVERTFTLAAGRSATYTDVLGSVFEQSSGAYGAIRISSDLASLAVLGQTSTPGFGGTFGQSVPAATPDDLVRVGAPQSVVAVREDDAFRTNLILANATGAPLDVDVALVADTGATLGTKRYSLPPFGMTQVGHVVRDLGVAANVSGARLILSTPTAGGAFAAYASAIDNTTNDPRTLLPR
jgi:6-phosphogluconolactonase